MLRRAASALLRLPLGRLLRGIGSGSLLVHLPDGSRLRREGAAPGPAAEIRLLRARALRRLLLEGDIGFAEAYADGDWDTPDLLAVLMLALRNGEALDARLRGSPVSRLLTRVRHRRRANTRDGSRRNVMAHYDLGNAFYARWLDRGMTYSSALYEGEARSLDAAQAAKIERAVAMLAPRPGETALEIGCGWGALMERLATVEDLRVTGITLSPAQRAHAQARLDAAGLSGRTEVALRDYRDLRGRFDRIVSIEMLEAVGAEYWPIFFRVLAGALAPAGRAVLQVITIAEERFAAYAVAPDFIQTHVFPGGMLPTRAILERETARAGLVVLETLRFGQDYATTLAEWASRFEAAWPAIARDGFDARFRRLWRYYLAYCEAGFRHGATDVVLLSLGHRAGRAA